MTEANMLQVMWSVRYDATTDRIVISQLGGAWMALHPIQLRQFVVALERAAGIRDAAQPKSGVDGHSDPPPMRPPPPEIPVGGFISPAPPPRTDGAWNPQQNPIHPSLHWTNLRCECHACTQARVPPHNPQRYSNT